MQQLTRWARNFANPKFRLDVTGRSALLVVRGIGERDWQYSGQVFSPLFS